MKNAINWFEIPSEDFERALKFYSTIFGIEMRVQNFGDLKMAFFPCEKDGVGGTIVHHPDHYKPSDQGVLIYLNANPDLDKVLSKVEKAGGKIIQSKKMVSPGVSMALVLDSEGNRIALHSVN